MTDRHPQILNASTNLLGICFAIITGLKVTGSNPKSYADEIAWCAVVCFLSSTLLSYLVIGANGVAHRRRAWSHRSFLAGVMSLAASVFVAAVSL